MHGEPAAQGTKVRAQPSPRSDERRAMEAKLFQQILLLTGISAAMMTLREVLTQSTFGPITIATLASAGLALFPGIWRARIHVVAPLFFATLVVLISKSALDLGGATAPALSMAFVPGFLAMLVLGPAWGWTISAAMLGFLAWFGLKTPLPSLVSQVRFVNEISMTVFAAGLGHSLVRSFALYELFIERRQAVLAGLESRRLALAQAIYEELEPAARSLPDALESAPPDESKPQGVEDAFDRLSSALQRAKHLSHQEITESTSLETTDPGIRRNTMRTWLRLSIALMIFFGIRNALVGENVLAPLFLIALCAAFDVWLRHARRDKHLELTALVMGIAISATVFFHIPVYGRTPGIPVLVLAPAAVLFTALLSRGPATWMVIAFNYGVLAWTATGRPLSLPEIRLVGDLAITFLIIIVALGSVFSLRSAFAQTLLEQAARKAEALRQHRRLAGTLFHDASNHLQAIILYLADASSVASRRSATALSRRVERLVSLSKQFLVSSPTLPPTLTDLRLTDAFALISEAFLPQLRAKQLSLTLMDGGEIPVRCDPDLFVESVLGNLVSNAIKFSPPGLTIEISATQTGQEVCVLVEDHGPGFPADVLIAGRGDGALPTRPGTQGEAGHGYGLRLAHEHAARMRGRVDMTNRTEGGARCMIWLEVARQGARMSPGSAP